MVNDMLPLHGVSAIDASAMLAHSGLATAGTAIGDLGLDRAILSPVPEVDFEDFFFQLLVGDAVAFAHHFPHRLGHQL